MPISLRFDVALVDNDSFSLECFPPLLHETHQANGVDAVDPVRGLFDVTLSLKTSRVLLTNLLEFRWGQIDKSCLLFDLVLV